jgi:hypothetical protein
MMAAANPAYRAMTEITKEEGSIRRFCGSLARLIPLRPRAGRHERDQVALPRASREAGPPVQPPVNRIIKQGTFDWGSFSAFEDGSIEIERAGLKERFLSFSELERSRNGRGRE